MPTAQQGIARANGAKSHGPESNAAFLHFHARLLADLAPKTAEAERLANQLITVLRDAQILHNGYLIYISELVHTLAAIAPHTGDPAKLIIEAQKLAINTDGGTVTRFQARISACNRTRHRSEHNLLRLEKMLPTSGPSQKMLKTNGRPQPPTRPANIADIGLEKITIQADHPRSH